MLDYRQNGRVVSRLETPACFATRSRATRRVVRVCLITFAQDHAVVPRANDLGTFSPWLAVGALCNESRYVEQVRCVGHTLRNTCERARYSHAERISPFEGDHRYAGSTPPQHCTHRLTYTRTYTQPAPCAPPRARIPFPSKVHTNGICSTPHRRTSGLLRFISSPITALFAVLYHDAIRD